MKIITLIWAFCRDHFRTAASLAEVSIIALFLSFALDPSSSKITGSWPYLSVAFSFLAIILPAVSTSILAGRSADNKITLLVLKAGKSACYVSLFLSSLFISIFWILIAVFIANRFYPLSGYPRLISFNVILCNLLITTALFTTFSSLTGKSVETMYAVIFIVLGLGFNRSSTRTSQESPHCAILRKSSRLHEA